MRHQKLSRFALLIRAWLTPFHSLTVTLIRFAGRHSHSHSHTPPPPFFPACFLVRFFLCYAQTLPCGPRIVDCDTVDFGCCSAERGLLNQLTFGLSISVLRLWLPSIRFGCAKESNKMASSTSSGLWAEIECVVLVAFLNVSANNNEKIDRKRRWNDEGQNCFVLFLSIWVCVVYRVCCDSIHDCRFVIFCFVGCLPNQT